MKASCSYCFQDTVLSQSLCEQCGATFGSCQCPAQLLCCKDCDKNLTTEDRIRQKINHWLNEGYDVGRILQRVTTIRRGQHEIAAQNAEFRAQQGA